MKKIIRGFSLIELMVVIATVAALAAVAAPVYNSYIAKAKLASIMQATDSIKTAMINYYNQNGVFADASDLGYQETSPGSDNILNPETINPAIGELQVSFIGTTCNERVGFYSVMLDSTSLNTGTNMYAIAQAFYNQDGVIKTVCTEGDENSVSLNLYCSNGITPIEYNTFITTASTLLCN